MKFVSIVKDVDSLGRIVLPKEIRDALEINESKVEITVMDDTIHVKKYKPGCTFCDREIDLIIYKDKYICAECRQLLSTPIS